MKPVTNIHDMSAYTRQLNTSYGDKRELYTEYQNEVLTKGFDYSKVKYVREKFPKFPLYLRKQIAEFI